MVKIAIFSDIHANLPALESVLASIDANRPDHIFCLGDLVGYAPWPNEVIDLMRQRNIATIAGNYDEGVGNHSDDCGCAYQEEIDKKRGNISIALSNEWITEDNRRWLRTLPRHIRLELGKDADFSVLMVHGSPRKINEYLFEDRKESSFRRHLTGNDANVMLFGHTHQAFHKVLADEADNVSGDGGRTIHRHAINTGSVGKPKDGDPRAGWVLLELDESLDACNPDTVRAQFIRTSYDVDSAARGIEESELPDAYAQMLRNGG